jgi:hypothetical protein
MSPVVLTFVPCCRLVPILHPCQTFLPNTPAPLSQGLLRSALAQEAELAQHLEGYPYATSGNKYDTQSFYYHSSAYNTSLRSRYSAKEMEVTDIEGVAPDLTTGNAASVYRAYRERLML